MYYLRPLLLLQMLLFSVPLLAQPLPTLIPYLQDNKWGYADTTGKVVIAPRWDVAYFFTGNHARVALHRPGKSDIYCLIDSAGNYVVPPERNWTGVATGWSGHLNTMDSNGRWGLIDTGNNLLIGYDWDAPVYSGMFPAAMADSFKVVSRKGLFGVLARNGKLVVPCMYGSAAADNQTEKTRTVHVADPDNMNGNNKYGLCRLDGTELLQPLYAEITYRESGDTVGFLARTTSDNDPGQQSLSRSKWFSYPSMKEGAIPAFIKTGGLYERSAFGYIITGQGRYGLMDTKRKVLIPCCNIERITADTIYQITTTYRSDSEIVATTWLDTRTLKPYAPPLKKVYYYRPWEYDHPTHFVCGNGARAFSNYQAQRAAIPPIYVDGREQKEFYKDSFFYSVHQYVSSGPFNTEVYGGWWSKKTGLPYAVYGEVRGSRFYGRYYGAVVDDSLRYVIPPMPNYQVQAFDSAANIITVSGYGGYALINREGEMLYRTRPNRLSGGFRWHGKLYAYTYTPYKVRTPKVEMLLDDIYRPEPARLQVTDTSGLPAPAWADRQITGVFPAVLLPKGEIAFMAADTAGVVSIVDPLGNVVNKNLSGKYTQLTYFGKGAFYARKKQQGTLVDVNNKPLAPALQVKWADEARIFRSGVSGNTEERCPGLLSVSGSINGQPQTLNFYVDYRGTVYASQGR